VKSLDKHLIAPVLTSLLLIGIFYLVSATLYSVIIFIPGVIFTFILYLLSYYRNPINRTRLLPLYLFALSIQLLHFTEEYLTDFTSALPELLGLEPYPMDYWVVFNMVAYAVFIWGGIIIFKRIKKLMIIPLFFILIGVLFNGIVHVGLAIYTGGYFSGLYTALAFVVLGPVLLKRMIESAE
jgi:hypothetical protein